MRKLLVVLPAYNEGNTLGPLLESVKSFMEKYDFAYKVIVVNDGSSDGTRQIAVDAEKLMPLEIVEHEINKGLSQTLKDGFLAAVKKANEGDIIIVMDADNTHPPVLIAGMVKLLDEGADVVIASRYQPGARMIGVPAFRRFLSYCASIIFRVVFPTAGVKDYTCGYRAYKARVLKRAFEDYGEGFVDREGFSCMVDVILKLRKYPIRFAEVPIDLRYDLKDSPSKMKVMKTVMETLRLVVERLVGHK